MSEFLTTDLYQLNMVASYVDRGMFAPATFSLYMRDLPEGWDWFVSSGVEDALEFLHEFQFMDDDLYFMEENLGFRDDRLDYFRKMQFDGDVRVIPEGRLFLPNEPILEVTAPLPVAQVVETALLNRISYQVGVATKAARCVLAAKGKPVVDFALRRTHGHDASLGVAYSTAIAGFMGTSNVEAARRYGLQPVGTMAHSYILSFPSEVEAFRAYVESHPDRATLLVDTYDTVQGIQNAILLARELEGKGKPALFGIRIDSGDLAFEASRAREMLDAEGLHHVQVVVSGDLDEYKIRSIESLDPGAVGSYGVGTRVGVVADAPYLHSVYKMVEYDGKPVQKRSVGKATLPGPKQVYRMSAFDMLTPADAPLPSDLRLLRLAMSEGRYEPGYSPWMGSNFIAVANARLRNDLSQFPRELRIELDRRMGPHTWYTDEYLD